MTGATLRLAKCVFVAGPAGGIRRQVNAEIFGERRFWWPAERRVAKIPELARRADGNNGLLRRTLPGVETVDAPRAGIGLRDHNDAVVADIAAIDGPVVLVGHSGGSGIIHGAVDAHPDWEQRAIDVDGGPLGVGGAVNDGLSAEGDEIPLPGGTSSRRPSSWT